MAGVRKRELLAKEQGVSVSKVVIKRPEGLSKLPRDRKRRKPPLMVLPLPPLMCGRKCSVTFSLSDCHKDPPQVLQDS